MAQRLKEELGVKRVAPAHCTGHLAFKILSDTYGSDFVSAGLGAEITTPIFTDQFVGKQIFDSNGKFTSVLVVKGGAQTLSKDMQIHAVDAISGGTITCNGVSDMIDNVISSYVPYIEKQK